MKIFKSRQAAGELLAKRLKDIKADLVLGIPRGGVVVAAVVAKKLNLPLDIIVTRKIGAPGQEELALGAVDSNGEVVWEERLLEDLGLKIEVLAEKINSEQEEIKRREQLYRGGKGNLEVQGKRVILVDDGIATGATVLAAINFLKRHHVKKIIVAVPVVSKEAVGKIIKTESKIVALEMPHHFQAVGQFYHEFEAVTDEQVIQLMV
jgi:predicted phosphoribosyltransferase